MYIGVATDTIAVTEMQNASAAKPKQTSISGRVKTRQLSVVTHFFFLMAMQMFVCLYLDNKTDAVMITSIKH